MPVWLQLFYFSSDFKHFAQPIVFRTGTGQGFVRVQRSCALRDQKTATSNLVSCNFPKLKELLKGQRLLQAAVRKW